MQVGRRQAHHDEAHENHERWLVTYSDLITLLLAFFIVLYSMSNLDAEKYKKLAESLGSAFGGKKGGQDKGVAGGAGGSVQAPENLTEAPKRKDTKKALGEGTNPTVNTGGGNPYEISPEFRALAERIKKVSFANGLGGQIVIREEGRGLVLHLVDTLLFPTGSAELSTQACHILTLVGEELSSLDNPIRVEGHTDNVPIKTPFYPNNWFLSTSRAMKVVQLWDDMRLISSSRLSGSGYGPNRPLDANDTAAGRAKNRRVDIVVIRESVALQEPKMVDGKVVTGTTEQGADGKATSESAGTAKEPAVPVAKGSGAATESTAKGSSKPRGH